MDNPYYTLCTRHSFPPSPGRETREGVRGRPQLPSGAVFSCNLTGEPLRRLKLHGQDASKTASPRHCEKIVLFGGT